MPLVPHPQTAPTIPTFPTTPAIDVAAALDLRRALRATRGHLVDVLAARVELASGLTSWSGPHRDRYEDESAALLAAGRALAASLDTLVAAVDAQLREAGPTIVRP